MTFRIGVCTSCGANYKLPASFAADQARCKNCGGVVQIGKAGEEAPKPAAPPVPAEKPAAATAAAKPKKKREGPSMKERLMAQRKAEAETAPKATPDAAAAPKASSVKASAKPAAGSKAAGKSGTTGSRRSRPAGSRGRASKKGGDDEEDGGGRRAGGRRRSAPAKKKAPVGGFIAAAVILAAVCGGAWWYFGQEEAAEVDEAPSIVADLADANVEGATSEGAGDGDGNGAVSAEDVASTDAGDGDDGGATEDEGAEDVAKEPTKPVKKAAPAGDPASVDLSVIPDYGPISGCSETRFAELQELAATMIDPMAGAAGNRARNKLVEAGKEAFPVILNSLKGLDLTDDDGFRSADVCQKALQDLCNGNNFGWKYPSQEPEKFHYFDKKVILSWSKAWDQAKDHDGAWAKLAKLDKIDKAEEPEEEMDGATEDALDALDDL